ncbi:ionotropic receptor 21a [Culicoides brevitarsis]|uniref:ionotropic receptor 21a n=1 Tax=Culicoides brevitarsis TaxID=469753 RepID=UPI00307BCC45
MPKSFLFLLLYFVRGEAFLWHEVNDIHRNFQQELIDYHSYNKYLPKSYDSGFSQYVYVAPGLQEGLNRTRREVDTTFYGHPKTREQIWHQNFKMNDLEFDQSSSLISLLMKILDKYMMRCIPVVIYDPFVEKSEGLLLQRLFSRLPMSYVHGKLDENYKLLDKNVLKPLDTRCRSYILFMADAMQARKVIGPQIDNKVIVIPRSTQWKLQEFLSSPESRDIINLLIIGESYSLDKSAERPFVLYTHNLYTDGLGSSRPKVLTSWMKGKLSRPHVNLFPKKLTKGFAGHRFTIVAAPQPPYVFKILQTDGVGNIQIQWDGLEIRLIKAMSQMMNFSFELIEPRNPKLGPGDSITYDIGDRRADIGLAGMYVTSERNIVQEMTAAHSLDCAAFLTLSSRALPRSRAILGPFRWEVWVCLIFIYLIAIFPLAFSDRLSLKHLWGNAGEIENMFWYVFGTFTNSLTFSGEFSWSNTKKTSTRMLIGWYWVFTIIITACYTGSIIAFVTLPVTPETIDTLDQLRDGFFRIGTYDRGGWERWFTNSTHEKTKKLLKKLEFVASAEEGVNNVTQAWFWPYAFIASKRELSYIIDTNYTDNKIGRRSALHVSEGCFALYSVGMALPSDSVYRTKFNDAILRMQENGVSQKMMRDVIYDAKKVASKGRVEAIFEERKAKKQATPEDRSLTLVDTEGMFMFLGIGYLIGVGALISEWVGGCSNRVINIVKIRKQEKKDRIEREEREAHPSRRPSFIRNLGKRISLSAKSMRSNASRGSRESLEPRGNGCSSRNSEASMTGLSKATLKELYDGPRKQKPSIVFLNGQMVPEDKVYDVREEIHLKEEASFDKASTGSSNLDGEEHSPDSNIETVVEINRPQSSSGEQRTGTSSRRSSQLATIDEGIFGDKVLP